MKRQVWVVELLDGGDTIELDCSYPTKKLATLRARHLRSELLRCRVVKYTPSFPSQKALRFLKKLANPPQRFHDDGEGNKHSGARGDCGRCQ